MNTQHPRGRRQPAELEGIDRKVDVAASVAQKTCALALALPLLRQQVREIIESCSRSYVLADGTIAYWRNTLSADDEAWVRPWREALHATEAALGQPGPEDGGTRYVDDQDEARRGGACPD